MAWEGSSTVYVGMIHSFSPEAQLLHSTQTQVSRSHHPISARQAQSSVASTPSLEAGNFPVSSEANLAPKLKSGCCWLKIRMRRSGSRMFMASTVSYHLTLHPLTKTFRSWRRGMVASRSKPSIALARTAGIQYISHLDHHSAMVHIGISFSL
jgi:hypothetical protein